MIGICDLDLFQKSSEKKLYIPNVEAMKIATYYTTEERQYCRLLTPDTEEDLSKYSQVFLCSEFDNYVPTSYRGYKNVVLCGTGFTNGTYKGFDNPLIDFMIPKTFIYKEFLQQQLKNDMTPKEIDGFLDNGYYRGYRVDEKLPSPPVLHRKRIYVYDRGISVSQWLSILTDLSSKLPSSIINIHPIECQRISEFFALRKFPSFARSNEVILDINVPANEVHLMFKKYRRNFLEDIVPTSNVFLPLGGTFPAYRGYYENLKYTLNLLYSFWSQNIPIKIYYKRPTIGANSPIAHLSEVIQVHCALDSKRRKETTILDDLKKWKKNEEALTEYEKLVEVHPEMKDLFNQNYTELVQRRYWRI